MTAHAPRRPQRARLSAAAQTALDGLVARHGDHGTAKRLGVTCHTVTALVYGGQARWDSVERVEAAVMAHADIEAREKRRLAFRDALMGTGEDEGSETT